MQTGRPQSNAVTHPLLLYTAITVTGAVLAFVSLRLMWRAIGHYKVRRAGPRPLVGVNHRLWRDPGDVERLDLSAGPGGRDGTPQPPFHFIEEHLNGSQPCMSVRDGRGRRWRVKWGHEVQPETFGVRLAWACGYFAEVTYYVARGAGRPHRWANPHGAVHRPSRPLQRREIRARRSRRLEAVRGAQLVVDRQPVRGHTRACRARVLMMLMSNWDNKDQRDVARGSNTAIYVHAPVALEARGAVPDHRLGRLDGPVGGDVGHARAVGSERLRGADAAVRHRRHRGVRAVRLYAASGPPTRREHSRGERRVAVPLSGPDHRRAIARGAAGQRRHARGPESFTTSLRVRIAQLQEVSAAAGQRSGLGSDPGTGF